MYRKHSFETKLNLVSKLKKGVPFRELSRSYQIDMMMLREWVRKYDLHGEQGLKKQSNARATAQIKEALVRKPFGFEIMDKISKKTRLYYSLPAK